jgi:hypothetical protein
MIYLFASDIRLHPLIPALKSSRSLAIFSKLLIAQIRNGLLILNYHRWPPVFKNSFHSAIYCTSGEQAAKRAAEGFDMVSLVPFAFCPTLTYLNIQINVTSDVGAMSEAVARHLAVASGL